MKIVTDQNLSAAKIDQIVPYPLAKRLFDFFASLTGLIIISPVFLIIFLAMKLEGLFRPNCRGPFFYKEIRISQGRPFNFYKIRIFKTEAIKQALGAIGIVHTKALEIKKENLTWVGKIIKKFYLDELAQLINVLRGEMSLVGTRPWNPASYEREINLGIYRKKMLKAGLTGLVQITKGHHQKYPGRDRGLDDYYVNFCRTHSSLAILFFDLKIIFLSLFKMIRGEGL